MIFSHTSKMANPTCTKIYKKRGAFNLLSFNLKMMTTYQTFLPRFLTSSTVLDMRALYVL